MTTDNQDHFWNVPTKSVLVETKGTKDTSTANFCVDSESSFAQQDEQVRMRMAGAQEQLPLLNAAIVSASSDLHQTKQQATYFCLLEAQCWREATSR